MTTIIGNKEFTVKQVGNRFYYWSFKAGRNLPVARKNVIFE